MISIVVPPEGYLKGIARLCKQYNALLICDEIQTVRHRYLSVFSFVLCWYVVLTVYLAFTGLVQDGQTAGVRVRGDPAGCRAFGQSPLGRRLSRLRSPCRQGRDALHPTG